MLIIHNQRNFKNGKVPFYVYRKGMNEMITQKEIDRYLLLLGKALRKERIKKRFPQFIIAERSCLSRNYISEVERGKRNLTIATLYRITKALDINPVDIFMQIDQKKI